MEESSLDKSFEVFSASMEDALKEGDELVFNLPSLGEGLPEK